MYNYQKHLSRTRFKKYLARIESEGELPLLSKMPEDDRIYLNVPYMNRDFAKCSHCLFDRESKLWFTGIYNRNLTELITLYGVNTNATSEKAKKLIRKCGIDPNTGKEIEPE